MSSDFVSPVKWTRVFDAATKVHYLTRARGGKACSHFSHCFIVSVEGDLIRVKLSERPGTVAAPPLRTPCTQQRELFVFRRAAPRRAAPRHRVFANP